MVTGPRLTVGADLDDPLDPRSLLATGLSGSTKPTAASSATPHPTDPRTGRPAHPSHHQP